MIYKYYYFLMIRCSFLLKPLINSIQIVTWFEVYFYSEKIYKNIIMYKNNNKVIMN